MAKEKEISLSGLVSSLSATINNAYNIGSILGYCFVDSLKDYVPSSDISREKQKQEEIERIYLSIDSAKKDLLHKEENDIISELGNSIKQYVANLRSDSSITKSILLKEFSRKLQSSDGNP
jgi:hypothetical protein